MALPDRIQLFGRDELRRRWLRSYKVAQPDADTSTKGQPYIDACAAADMQLPIYANIAAIGDVHSLDNRTEEELDQIGDAEGIPRPPATGSSGYVILRAATGGCSIFENDELVYRPTNNRYVVAATSLYANGGQVPIVGLDTGPASDLPAGAELEWTNPRPGCESIATVWSEGLTGGREQASAEEFKALIRERRKSPVGQGNEAAYLALIEDAFAHGVAVQKGFVWPAIKHTGSIGFSFLMRPSIPGGSRLPSTAQLGIVGAALEGAHSFDDGIFAILLSEQSAAVSFEVAWKASATGWADINPWPAYIPSAQLVVSGAASITASGFRVATTGTTTAPVAGQTIALYDASTTTAETRFKRKKIATVTQVTANKVWDLTFDMTANASDTFVPTAGALVSPWSDSLNLVTSAVVGYFDVMGPGEMVSTFYDRGRRQRRIPESPDSWTSEISSQLDARVQAVSAVRSASLLVPTSPASTTVGTPGALAYVRRLTDLAFYPE